ncbi:MAG: hypothetical protein GFH27_549293n38 [Chloroflexi bacterium AL-W]|nr:hypothetical protein [Chloroflexi bacterium AL-N1]NOK67848.1 hypothetical protein [Chloroflexi bacterium AL-N10]NOK75383.1 hypothetical protein [Chloroflexi bacterium AL-N5]NOK82171.1 hypothetical protein [Chloroflexi bacterium AL-W]NOK90016.1 hypothetical protein [Chloroflexi bacterium AL-N15]
MRRTFFLVLLVCLSAGLLVSPSQAQSNERCFEETGYCIAGPIRAYWENNGGLAVFGFPITEVREGHIEESDWRGPVQWFERDRLEDHGDGLVLAGRLGAELLARQARPWETALKVEGAPPECRYFPETGHSLCAPFRSYWEQNGGLERFGYPITEPGAEFIEGTTLTVQYFERRRMEHHVDLAGTPFEVQLGLLGAQLISTTGCFQAGPPLQATAYVYRDSLGCTIGNAHATTMAFQPFERGAMIWFPSLARVPRIYVLFRSDDGQLTHEIHGDVGAPPEPEDRAEAPEGLYTPENGFGRLWHESPSIRERLGWAIAPEEAFDGIFYQFEKGNMIYRSNATTDEVTIMYSQNGGAEVIPRITTPDMQ